MTPTQLKLLRGETRRQRLNPTEPKPAHLRPEMPADLAAGAQPIWKTVLDEMPAGVITGADGFVLRLFAESMARYQHAAGLLEQTGILLQARGNGARAGELVKSPLNQIVRDNATLARALAGDLGLTPSARANLHAPAAPLNDDGLAALLIPRRRSG